MSERYSILDLSKLVRVARENCILGLYEKALSKYQIAIPIIQARILEVNDSLLKEKWKNIEKNLKEEENTINEIMKSCNVFKNIYTESGDKKAVNLGGVDLDNIPTNPHDAKIEKDADMLRRLQGVEPEKKQPARKNDKNDFDAQDILNNVKMVQNISSQVENKINNIQKNNDYQPRKQQPAPQPKYTPPPASNNYGGGYGGGHGGGRVNPMALINDAINNHPANKNMQDKYGHLANLGPDGYVKGNYGGGGAGRRASGGGNQGGKGGNKNAGGAGGKKDAKNENGKSPFLLSR